MATDRNRDAFDQLCCYTLSHAGADFIHQHVVDAFAAQDATTDDKPIRLAFALVGLYLHVEKGFSGREVQLAHMKLARTKQDWPVFDLPADRGEITAATVISAPPEFRDETIHKWTGSVWNAYSDQRGPVEALLSKNGVSDRYSV